MVLELDFFAMEKINSQNNSFSGSRSSIPLINPTTSSWMVNGSAPKKLPLTMFYRGRVNVFHVVPDTADFILKLAKEGAMDNAIQHGVFPLYTARKRSLQRFFETRKQRLINTGPYSSKVNKAVGGENYIK